MGVLETVKAFYRGAQPPFPKLEGPINLTSQTRSYELSHPQSAEIEVALEDVEIDWVRAGNCWSIESEFGVDIWAGFVEEEEWELDAEGVRIPLLGPLRGLLEVEVSPSFSTRGAAGFIVQSLIEAAQAFRASGIQPGIITQGSLLEFTIGGETVADAIESIKASTDLDYRERVRETSEGGLEFFLDFGDLRRSTNILLTRREIVAGVFTRGRFPGGLTVLGPGASFDEREAVTVVGSDRAAFSDQTIPFSTGNVLELRDADIGPAAIRHVAVVDDRLSNLQSSTEQRYFDLLQGVQEILVTVDLTLGGAPKLGDVVGLRVHNWAGAFNIDVDDAHVHAVEPHEEDGSLDLALGLHPHG